MSEIILKNLYMNGNKVPLMIRNGEIIYRMYTKLVFSVDTDSITFESTGGTYTINITANDNWSMTIPEFVTASVISGTGNASITISTTGETTDTELTGNIVITCNGNTHTINVTQKASVIDYSTHYLTFKITTSGVLKWWANYTVSTLKRTIQYSKDNGTTWTNYESNNSSSGTSLSVVAGDVILFKGSNNNYGTAYNRFNTFRFSTCKFEVEGNILSLIYGDNFVGKSMTASTYNFTGLFNQCTGLTSAENLILSTTNLSSRTYCYGYMFSNCTSLTKAPELPATTLANYCYCEMFRSCISLIKPPSILSATSLPNYCYYMLFNNCQSLNYVKCLATSGINRNSSTSSWLNSVSATGTFVKTSGVTWPSGTSGIPDGWTVIEE